MGGPLRPGCQTAQVARRNPCIAQLSKDEAGGRVGATGQDRHVPSIPAVEGRGTTAEHGAYAGDRVP